MHTKGNISDITVDNKTILHPLTPQRLNHHHTFFLKTTTVPFALIHIKESRGTQDLLFATFAVILFAVIASVTLTLNVAQQDGA